MGNSFSSTKKSYKSSPNNAYKKYYAFCARLCKASLYGAAEITNRNYGTLPANKKQIQICGIKTCHPIEKLRS